VDDDADVEIHDEWLTVDERLVREHSCRQQAVTLRCETNLRTTQQNHDIGDAIERENTEAARPGHQFNDGQSWKFLDRFNLEAIGRW
jgi:hypothetical protein